MMTNQQLIDILEGYDPDQEVRIMSQPNWPFEYSLAGAVQATDIPERDGDDYDEEDDDEPRAEGYVSPKPTRNGKPAIYLIEGSQLCYGTKNAWGASNA